MTDPSAADGLSEAVRSRIDALYDTALVPKLAAIDDWRRTVRRLIIKALIPIVPPALFLMAGDLLDGILPFSTGLATTAIGVVALMAAVVFAGVRYLLPGVTAFANYRARFKSDVVAEVFKVVLPSASYDPLQGIRREVFDAAGLFSARGSYVSDDRVRGRIGQTPFEAADIGRSYSSGGKNSTTYVVFRGLFFHLDFNKRVRGVTYVDPESAKPHQVGDRSGLTLVALENHEFEKEFKVWASDDVEARYILTPTMMEQLLALRAHAGKPIFLGFKAHQAYIGVHYGSPLFEPGIAQTTSKAAILEMAEHFALAETIVRELDLNTRIWTKDVDDAVLTQPDTTPHALDVLAAEKAGSLTASDVWAAASKATDDSTNDDLASAPRPAQTAIRFEERPAGVSIVYGLRKSFWLPMLISLAGWLLCFSAARAWDGPEWFSGASTFLRSFPAVPGLSAFAADAPVPWMIVGSVVGGLFWLWWAGYVRRVEVDADRIRIYRGWRPFPRTYARPTYGRVIRVNTAVYIGKVEGVHLVNPTASPMLSEPEARWLSAELKRVFGQTGPRTPS